MTTELRRVRKVRSPTTTNTWCQPCIVGLNCTQGMKVGL